ncbi:hypothetical protein D1872_296090 [compost metagenome]
MAEKLELILCLCFLHIRLHITVHNLKRIRVQLVQECLLLAGFFDDLLFLYQLFFCLNQRLIETEFRWYCLSGLYPVNSPFHLTSSEACTTLRLRIVRTMKLNHLAVRILDDVIALDEISMLQTNLVARE